MFQLEKSFPFNEYVSIILEKYIVSIIEIRIVDWIILIILLLIILSDSTYWAQSSMKIFGKCGQNLSEEDHLFCEELKSAQFFTLIGYNNNNNNNNNNNYYYYYYYY